MHWDQWSKFTSSLALDSLLDSIRDKIPMLQVFAIRVRNGSLAKHGEPVRSRTVEDYLRSIGQTFCAMGLPDPRLDLSMSTDFRLQRMLKAFSKKDPPPNRVKPVPVQVLHRIMTVARAGNDPFQLATADMITLAFFFLLRPGEYTSSPSDTTPFTLQDVQLFSGQRRLDLSTAPEASIRSATFATLTFTNQKNGVRGEVIGLGTSGNPHLCPVRAVVRRILHLRASQADPSTPLATVIHNNRVHRSHPRPSRPHSAPQSPSSVPPLVSYRQTSAPAACEQRELTPSSVPMSIRTSSAFSAAGARMKCCGTCTFKQPP